MSARLVGYWKSSLRDSYPLPQHFESPLDPGVRSRLVAYLNAGQVVNQYRGNSHCRYGCGDNGSAERTDGEWLWPEGLAHYVATHGVALPQEFIDHVPRTDSLPVDGAVTGSHVRADEDDWLRWSDEKMPNDFKAAVRNAIAVADQDAIEAIEAAGRGLEEQNGIGEAPCVMAGCQRRACRDRALCGRCLIIGSGTEELIRSQCDTEQLRVLLFTRE